MLTSIKVRHNFKKSHDASANKFVLTLWRLELSLTALPPECLTGLMSIVKLLEMSLIVILACVSKGTWYLT